MPTDVAAIAARLAAITPESWETDETGCCVYARPDSRCIAQVVVGGDGTEADAAFIAHAPGDISDLLKENEHLRTLLVKVFEAERWDEIHALRPVAHSLIGEAHDSHD